MKIKNGKVYNSSGVFEHKDLFFEGEFITSASKTNDEFDATDMYIIPGLIDIHMHGAMGYDFCDATYEALKTIADYEAKNGVTAIAPASMTFPEEILDNIFKNFADFNYDKGSMIVGIHMEGPFLSYEKRGAQNPTYLSNPQVDIFRRLNKKANGKIKIVTLAPESENALDFIEQLHDEVVISLGHTTSNYELADKSFKLGAKQVTHLYNAMPPLHHRDPGVIGAASDNEHVNAELICDGIHIHPSAVRIAFKIFGHERICLISDTMMAAGLTDGDYSLGGQAVKVVGKLATLESGTIAGSATNLMDCLKTAISFDIPIEKAIWSATVTPAKAIGEYDRMGSLDEGKLANIVILDKNLNIVKVYIKGREVSI